MGAPQNAASGAVEGKPVGRVRGAADKKPRSRSGYVAAWEEGGSRRAAIRSGDAR